jgi:hypothetical protein
MLEIWTMCCGYLSAAIRLAHAEEAAAAEAAALASEAARVRPNTPVIVGLRRKSIALRVSRPPL